MSPLHAHQNGFLQILGTSHLSGSENPPVLQKATWSYSICDMNEKGLESKSKSWTWDKLNPYAYRLINIGMGMYSQQIASFSMFCLQLAPWPQSPQHCPPVAQLSEALMQRRADSQAVISQYLWAIHHLRDLLTRVTNHQLWQSSKQPSGNTYCNPIWLPHDYTQTSIVGSISPLNNLTSVDHLTNNSVSYVCWSLTIISCRLIGC